MWKFHQLRGRHVSLENDCTTAKRLNGSGCGICFTNTPLVNGEVFEIQVDNTGAKLKSAVSLGVTPHIPPNPTEIRSGVFITGVRMLHGPRVWENKNGGIFRPYSLKSHDLQVGDKLGMMKAPDSTLHFYLNGNDHGIGFSNLPEVVFGVVDVYGSGSEVSIINQAESATESGAQAAIKKAPNFSGRPAEWNVQTVCDFIESIPECVPYVAKFQLERINGAALLELDKKDLKDFFEMPLGLAVNVCSHLKKYEEKINETCSICLQYKCHVHISILYRLLLVLCLYTSYYLYNYNYTRNHFYHCFREKIITCTTPVFDLYLFLLLF